jgi:hypothetical protein
MAFLKYRGNSTTPDAWTSTVAANAPLSNDDIDKNFASLNAQKLDLAGGTLSGTLDAGTHITAELKDDSIAFVDGSDTSKKLTFQLSGITTSTTRTLTVPNLNGTIALTSDLDDTLADVTGRGATTSNAIAITNATSSTNTSTGALVVDGGVAVAENLNVGGNHEVGGNLTVTGNLVINGTTTTVNSTTVSVDDKNIELGSVESPSNTTADGGGITLKGLTDKTFNWVNSTSAWTSSEHINIASGKTYYINGTAVLSSSELGSGVTSSSLTSVGTLDSGTWNATTIATTKGGTGLSTYASGDILYASSSNTLSALAAGLDGQVLRLISGLPAWTTDENTDVLQSIASTTTDDSYYITFVASSAGTQTGLSNSNVRVNPSTGTISASNFDSTSDARFKSELNVIGNALDKLTQLTGYTFTMIESGQRSSGLIAQDVEVVLPEAIGGTEDKKTIAYGAMTGLIVEALKELNAKVVELQKQLEDK